MRPRRPGLGSARTYKVVRGQTGADRESTWLLVFSGGPSAVPPVRFRGHADRGRPVRFARPGRSCRRARRRQPRAETLPEAIPTGGPGGRCRAGPARPQTGRGARWPGGAGDDRRGAAPVLAPAGSVAGGPGRPRYTGARRIGSGPGPGRTRRAGRSGSARAAARAEAGRAVGVLSFGSTPTRSDGGPAGRRPRDLTGRTGRDRTDRDRDGRVCGIRRRPDVVASNPGRDDTWLRPRLPSSPFALRGWGLERAEAIHRGSGATAFSEP